MTDGLRNRQKAETRQEILAAAKGLFLQLGYEGTTTRHIADAAGVATGTVFAHFSDKQCLLRELLLHDVNAVLIQARAKLSNRAGAVKALLHYAESLYAYYRSQWALSRIVLQDGIFNASQYQGQLAAFREELTKRLAYDAPSLKEADRAIFAQCLMANYFMVLAEGMGKPESSLQEWMTQLERRCRLLLRLAKEHHE